MAMLIDKGLLLILGVYLTAGEQGFAKPVISLLLAVITAGVYSYITKKEQKKLLTIIFLVVCIFLPELCFFLPVLYYDCTRERFYWSGIGIFLYLILLVQKVEPEKTALWMIAVAISVVLSLRTNRIEKLSTELIRLRDTSTELNIVLKEKNKNLMEKQDYEIYLATLKERNRIAREIHDNVGHMLSRSILQVGALMAVYKEEALHEQLSGVNETLNQAMTSIRESVHDLHDNAIDLEQVVREAVEPLKEQYHATVDYDMSPDVPRNIKYCFIMAVKEGMSNIIKYSNATQVSVILREHPAFYQLTIEDNGTIEKKPENSDGIGLSNMRDRVEGLGGTFRIHTEQGFKIFISIKK